jgi:tight adherence protein C
MADRVQIEAFTAFVGVVSYGTEIGASISETLRMQGKELRRTRFALAERKAARAPSVMIIPLVCFIMPAVFIVIITPVVLKYKAMGLGLD